jgi:hypothetical protein
MKKVSIIITVLFALFILSNPVLADTEDDYRTALKYFNSGNYEESISYFKAYVEKKPDPKAYYSLGYALYELGRHDEAMEYFKDAYLIDPEISPVPAGYYETYKQEKARRGFEQPVAETTTDEPGAKMEPAGGKIEKKIQPQQPTVPAAAVEKKAPPPPVSKPAETKTPPAVTQKPAEPKVAPPPAPPVLPKKIQPPPQLPKFSPDDKQIPGIPSGLIAMIYAFGIIFQIIALVLFIFMALCHFLIGRKLDVSASWLAFIPIVGAFWPLVGAARKPWWWILILFFVPLVNLILFIYCYMLVTENLGKNKWLGLLMLVPFVNFFFLAYLAFSKSSETSGGSYDGYDEGPVNEEAKQMFED